MSIKARAILLAVLGGLLLVGSAQAHAEYLRSEPGHGAVVATPPARVDIWFTQELFRRQGENRIEVYGPDGQAVHLDEAQIDDDDRRHLWVLLQPGMPPGEYRVEWRSLSAEDGHPGEGDFGFTLDPQAAVTSTPMVAPPGGAGPPAETLINSPLPSTGVPSPAATGAQPASGGGGCLLGLLPVWLFAGVALNYHRRRSIR
jgi:methionine-rich copper-binding protein CopC